MIYSYLTVSTGRSLGRFETKLTDALLLAPPQSVLVLWDVGCALGGPWPPLGFCNSGHLPLLRLLVSPGCHVIPLRKQRRYTEPVESVDESMHFSFFQKIRLDLCKPGTSEVRPVFQFPPARSLRHKTSNKIHAWRKAILYFIGRWQKSCSWSLLSYSVAVGTNIFLLSTFTASWTKAGSKRCWENAELACARRHPRLWTSTRTTWGQD